MSKGLSLLAMLFLLAILGAIVAFAVSEERVGTRRNDGKLGAFLAESMAFARSSPALIAFLAIGVAWGVAFSAVETYWQPRVASIVGAAGSDRLNGFLSAGYFLAALVGGLVAAPLLEKTRVGVGPALVALRLLTAAFIAALALQASAIGFAALYLTMFFWNGIASPLEATALNRMIPADKRASMLSALSLSVQLGGFSGAIGFGLVVGRHGIVLAWLVAAGILAASAFLFLLVGKGAQAVSTGVSGR